MNVDFSACRFFPLSSEEAWQIRDQFGTPVFVYDTSTIRHHIRQALAFPHAFGLTVRYAIKANPNSAILKWMHALGLSFDASSGFEAERSIRAGIPAADISLSAQELPRNLPSLADAGVRFVATSLHQLDSWGRLFPGSTVAVRFNPGTGSGHNQRTNVGGDTSSFGIWHEFVDQVGATLQRHRLVLDRIHTHIGSGGDPEVWQQVASLSLALVEQFPSVKALDLGGGFRVARMETEPSMQLVTVGTPIQQAFENFAARTGRKIHLEIEPGSYLVANGGILLASIVDVVSTGERGYRFLRTDTGMTEILRPAMYGAQHPMAIIPAADQARTQSLEDYVVVGHCCESGDILTPAAGDPESIATRRLPVADAGDLIVLGGAGAYCAAMSATNYNSFPVAPEILRSGPGQYRLIRRRQTVEELTDLETDAEG